jgi:hypothetical protein
MPSHFGQNTATAAHAHSTELSKSGHTHEEPQDKGQSRLYTSLPALRIHVRSGCTACTVNVGRAKESHGCVAAAHHTQYITPLMVQLSALCEAPLKNDCRV